MTTPIHVSSNVYQAIERSIRKDSTIDETEIKQITKAIEKDGITEDEQKLLDGINSSEVNVLTVKSSDDDPVLDITTFPAQHIEGISNRRVYGGVDSAPYDTALRKTKIEILNKDSLRATDWMDATDFNQILADLKPRELEGLVKAATEVDKQSQSDIRTRHLVGTLADHLDAKGAAQLQQKLSPASLELLKEHMAKLDPEQQEKLKALGF